MTPIISYADGAYSVHFYAEHVSEDDFPNSEYEVHLSVCGNEYTICSGVDCNKCSIETFCYKDVSNLQILLNLIPTFADDYPHLCV